MEPTTNKELQLSSLEQRQAELQSRIDQIDFEIGQVDEQFAELAAQFSGVNGQDSLRQASALEAKLANLRREKSLALAAQSHTTAQQLAEQEAQAEQARRATLAEARKLADGICTLNAEVDTHLTQLRQLFERRAGLLHQLAATDVANPVTINKLEGKAGATRAACAAGLHKYISVEKVATQSFVTLASCNVILLGVGRESVISSPPPPMSEAGATVDQHPLPATAAPPPTNGSGLDNVQSNGNRRRRLFGGGPND
jgi:hypothetical protein